ncbi:hypothetical protein PR048_026414 [Dryococelus australis]|uniref:CST complex subunit CTC1 n=1 Tax=Dryococelus australis TaxID=614101 RepID=A0ABQ9GLB6_9NEOP|nr:hypothetical protein PR048_026414 [Dryococelus australis]
MPALVTPYAVGVVPLEFEAAWELLDIRGGRVRCLDAQYCAPQDVATLPVAVEPRSTNRRSRIMKFRWCNTYVGTKIKLDPGSELDHSISDRGRCWCNLCRYPACGADCSLSQGLHIRNSTIINDVTRKYKCTMSTFRLFLSTAEITDEYFFTNGMSLTSGCSVVWVGASEDMCTRCWESMRVIERQNEMVGETGEPRENPSTSSIVRHDSHMRISRSEQANRSATVSPSGLEDTLRAETLYAGHVVPTVADAIICRVKLQAGNAESQQSKGLIDTLPRDYLANDVVDTCARRWRRGVRAYHRSRTATVCLQGRPGEGRGGRKGDNVRSYVVVDSHLVTACLCVCVPSNSIEKIVRIKAPCEVLVVSAGEVEANAFPTASFKLLICLITVGKLPCAGCTPTMHCHRMIRHDFGVATPEMLLHDIDREHLLYWGFGKELATARSEVSLQYSSGMMLGNTSEVSRTGNRAKVLRNVSNRCLPLCHLARGAGIKGRGKREIPEKTRQPTIPTCENLVIRPGIEPAGGRSTSLIPPYSHKVNLGEGGFELHLPLTLLLNLLLNGSSLSSAIEELILCCDWSTPSSAICSTIAPTPTPVCGAIVEQIVEQGELERPAPSQSSSGPRSRDLLLVTGSGKAVTLQSSPWHSDGKGGWGRLPYLFYINRAVLVEPLKGSCSGAEIARGAQASDDCRRLVAFVVLINGSVVVVRLDSRPRLTALSTQIPEELYTSFLAELGTDIIQEFSQDAVFNYFQIVLNYFPIMARS